MKTKPFSNYDAAKNYNIEEFTERGILFRIMLFSDETPINQMGKFYKFGVLSDTGEKSWFFNGACVCNDRLKAISIFLGLQNYCDINIGGRVFAIKTVKEA